MKHQVHNLIILDESGSMQSIKPFILQGFNELVQTIKGIEKQFPEQEHFISMVSFNGLRNNILHFIDPVSKMELIDETKYRPEANTPLFDAMGYSISKLRQVLVNQTDYHVLVTILTDGEENASKEYTVGAIKALIEELKLNNWTFSYIGADHDVEKFAYEMAVDYCIEFNKNEVDIKTLFKKESEIKAKISQMINDKQVFGKDLYEESGK